MIGHSFSVNMKEPTSSVYFHNLSIAFFIAPLALFLSGADFSMPNQKNVKRL